METVIAILLLALIIIALLIGISILWSLPIKWLQKRYNRTGWFGWAIFFNIFFGWATPIMAFCLWCKGPDMEGKTELDDISEKMDKINKSLEDIALLMKEKSQL